MATAVEKLISLKSILFTRIVATGGPSVCLSRHEYHKFYQLNNVILHFKVFLLFCLPPTEKRAVTFSNLTIDAISRVMSPEGATVNSNRAGDLQYDTTA